MEALKKIIEDLQKDWHEFKQDNDTRLKLVESKGAVDPLLKEKVEKASNGIGEMQAKVLDMQKHLDRIAAAQSAVIIDPKEEKAMQKYVGHEQYNGMFFDGQKFDHKKDSEYKEAINHYLRTNEPGKLIKIRSEQKASMTAGTDSTGGYLVRPEMGELIHHIVAEYGPWHQYVDKVTIGSSSIKWPLSDKRIGASRSYETASIAVQNGMTFLNAEIQAGGLYARPKISQDLLDDSVVNLEAMIMEAAALEFIITESTEIVSGDGVLGCRGITTYASGTSAGQIEQVVSGHATLLNNADKIHDVYNKMKAAYRQGAAWFGERATYNAIRQLKDGNGQYLWQPGLTLGQPSLLIGVPVVEAEDMASIGASALPLALANMKVAYKLVERMGMRILRDPYTSPGFVIYHITKRVGGAVVVHEAVKLLKISA